MSLEAITIPPTTERSPASLVVMLHGWGANCHDLAPLAPALNLPDCLFLFPDAPFPHPQVPGGKMWYDLEREDERGLLESRQRLYDWLKSLESSTGVPLERTILSGFSQGGAMTLDVGLQLPVAGLVSMSGYLHGEPEPTGDRLPPTLIMHGTLDPIVPLKAAHQARDRFAKLGVFLEYRELMMGHEILPEQVEEMRTFVAEVLSGAVQPNVEKP
ncbi:alpha/beta hydrolase [Phormidium sp. CCY1219]|uniref:alpha/beta hydrolase n=1 Tax=Phormidium sp. CCY1219 TaxID=2886104 RepID=UPI002D1EE2BC|nr:alpha/beta hydrolase [Phormidium sp. CCY1219]MEB3828525.1 alpha/beta hydrolase [Phormidium sp. CCY1219]